MGGKVKILKVEPSRRHILVTFMYIEEGHPLHGEEQKLSFEPVASSERIVAYLNVKAKTDGVAPAPPQKRLEALKRLEGYEFEVM